VAQIGANVARAGDTDPEPLRVSAPRPATPQGRLI
jgi:hypothetical protein